MLASPPDSFACKPAPGRGTLLRPAVPLRAQHLLMAALTSCAPPHLRSLRDETCLILPRPHPDMRSVPHAGCDEPTATAAAAVTAHPSVVCDAPWHAPHVECCDEGSGSATPDRRAGSSAYARRVVPMLPPARQYECGAKTAPRRAVATHTRGGTRGRGAVGGGSWVAAPSLPHGPGGRNREEKTQARLSPQRPASPPLPLPPTPTHPVFSRRTPFSEGSSSPLSPRLPSRRWATSCRRQRSTARSGGGGTRASWHLRRLRRWARPCLAAPRSLPWLRSPQRRSRFPGGVWRLRCWVPRCSSAPWRRPGGARRVRARRVCAGGRAAAALRSGDRGGAGSQHRPCRCRSGRRRRSSISCCGWWWSAARRRRRQ